MELFIYPHTVGAVQDLFIDATVQLKDEISEMQLMPRKDVPDILDHLDSIQIKQGRLNAYTEILEQLDNFVDDYVPPPGL